MIRRPAPLLLCLLFALVVCLLAVNTSVFTRADTAPNSWLDKTIETSKRKDLSAQDFGDRSNKSSDCTIQNTQEWVPTPWWVWATPKELATGSQCLYAGATGYYGEDNTSSFILPYSSTQMQRLTTQYGNYVRSSEQWTQSVPNTNKLLLITGLYGAWHNPGARNLHIVNDWNKTYAVEPLPTGLGNPQRKMVDASDYIVSDNGQPVEGIRPDGLATSANGEWVHALVENKAYVVLNTDTHQVIPYADATSPNYATKVDVSNDGRFVARSYELHSLKIYDTTRCQADQGNFVSRNCDSKELLEGEDSLLRMLFPGKEIVIGRVQFIGSGSALDVDLRIGDGTNYSYYTYRLKPSGSEPVKYLALGDSFSSGEGAYTYRSPTDFYIDDNNYNLCHLSKNSYPYLIQKAQNFDWFNSIACSGAQTKDLMYSGTPLKYLQDRNTGSQAKTNNTTVGQIENAIDNIIPGYTPQITVEQNYEPNVATLSIGGNDVGFGEIIKKCVLYGGDNDILCYNSRDEREKLANSIDELIPRFANIFSQVKASMGSANPRLYVIGYPKIISPESMCGANVLMLPPETHFADTLTDYLNAAIKTSAERAGARYVSVANAFVDDQGKDFRLCGDQPLLAVNGLTLNGESSKTPNAPVYSESFHPNQLGHSLEAQVVQDATASLTLEMPQERKDASIPIERRVALVGDSEIRYPNYSIKLKNDVAPDMIFKQDTLNFNFSLDDDMLPPENGTSAAIEIRSNPISLGNLQIINGAVQGSVVIPGNIEPGYHEIHIIYTDISGHTVDIYKHVYVANSKDDWDGDGINNNDDPCSITKQINQDIDEDGIDDACDGEYIKNVQSSGEGKGYASKSMEQEKNAVTKKIFTLNIPQDNPTLDETFESSSNNFILPKPSEIGDKSNSDDDFNNTKISQKDSFGEMMFFAGFAVLAIFASAGWLLNRRQN